MTLAQLKLRLLWQKTVLDQLAGYVADLQATDWWRRGDAPPEYQLEGDEDEPYDRD